MQEFQYISDILREFYTPAIVNQLWKKSPLWAIIKKRTKDMVGKRVVTPVRIGLTEAVGGRVDNNNTLPTAQRNLYDQAYITMKRVYGRVKVDGLSIASAKGKGGWIDVLQGEIQGVTDAFSLDIDRQLIGGGQAVLGHCSGVNSGTTTVPVDNPGGIVDATAKARFFRKGMVVDILDIGSGTVKNADSLQITSVDTAGNIVLSAIPTETADGDTIHREDTCSTNVYDETVGEMMGIDGIVQANVGAPGAALFQGIDATSEVSWRSFVDATDEVISEQLIQEDLDAIDNNTDGEPVDLILTSYTLRNKLISLVKAYYKTETLNLVAGWKAIKYTGGNAELPVLAHKNCPAKYMYYLSRPHLTLWTLKNLVWDDKGGGVVKPVAGADAYEAWFKIYANLGTDCRNAHGKRTSYKTA